MTGSSCEDVRDALLAGRSGSAPELEAHAEGCEHCATLLLEQASLGHALAASQATLETGGAVFSGLEHSLQAETGLRAWLGSRPTPVRVALALGGVAGVMLLGLRHLRADLAELPLAVVVTWLAAFGVVAVGLVLLALRELGRVEATVSRQQSWLVAAFALPAAYALTAASMFGGSPASFSLAWLERTLSCFGYGLVLCSPLVALLWLLDRGAGPRTRVLAAAAAAGIAANGALLLHCAASDPAHLVLGHVAISAALALSAWRLASKARSR